MKQPILSMVIFSSSAQERNDREWDRRRARIDLAGPMDAGISRATVRTMAPDWTPCHRMPMLG